MITLIVPTRNRAHTLRKVLGSYFAQQDISEFIFVIDDGTDETAEVISLAASEYPEKIIKILRNANRKGASESRNVGVREAQNEFIMFCDDDEYLETHYSSICLAKLNNPGVGAVSGRRVYMRSGETISAAIRRFGFGIRKSPAFRPIICEYVNGARYEGDIALPFTNAIILTRKDLLVRFPFDSFYSKGNGYREETDFQMNLFVHGYKIIVSNDCHSIHLPMSEVRSGGQRAGRLQRLGWSIYYTNYFFRKYYTRYASRMGLRLPQLFALLAFSIFAAYKELVRPPLYFLWSEFLDRSGHRHK